MTFLVRVSLLLFLASIYRFYSGYKRAEISHLSRVNIVVNSSKIILVSLTDRQVILLDLSKEEKIRFSRGYGDYPLSSAYKLGDLDGRGEQLLSESVENFLGLPIEGVIYVEDNLDCELLVNQSRKCLEALILKTLRRKEKSSLSFFDLVHLWVRVRSVSKFNFKTYHLAELNAKAREDFISKNFQDEKMVKENLSVAVFNSTEFPGLGNQASRLITNLGGRVVNVGNSPLQEETTIIANNRAVDSYTLTRLRKLFSVIWEEGGIEAGRADIGVFLGLDYWKKYNQKW